MSIIKVICIKQFILVVYYTKAECYNYAIVDRNGIVYKPNGIFYTKEAAEREGRKEIKTVSK